MKSKVLFLLFYLTVNVPFVLAGLTSFRQITNARAAGFADALTSFPNEGNCLLVNPATLGTLAGKQVSFTQGKLFVDQQYILINLSLPLYGMVYFGLSYADYSYGVAELNFVDGYSTKVFAGQDVYTIFAVATKLNLRTSVGLSLKKIKSVIAETYTGETVDADTGLVYYLPLDKVRNLYFGFAVQNILNRGLIYLQSKENLSLIYRTGITYLVKPVGKNNFLATTDLVVSLPAVYRLHFGMELGLFKNKVLFRAGYKVGYDSETVTLGLGLTLNKLSLDLAGTFAPPFDYIYRIGTTLSW